MENPNFKFMENPKNILVAPLNWGLGHATRCIPVINALLENGYNPILASDGNSLQLLKKEFPNLQTLELPSYQIEYPKNGVFFKLKMLQNTPNMLFSIYKEKKIVKKWIAQYNIEGIISDNRFGVFSKKIPSVFITHQLNVLSGKTSWLTSKLHQNIIKKYTECWVPDYEQKPNLSGRLGHIENADFDVKYIGPISRMEKKELPKKYDLMVLLSGPEPQRSMLENQIKVEVQKFNGEVIFVKGTVETEQKTEQIKNITYYNFMNSKQLEQTFNESDLVLCRSGYTTIMDLAKLGKKAFFIPTPGQFEQEHLAKKLKHEGIVPFNKQDGFKISNLFAVDLYKGFNYKLNPVVDWKNLFGAFETKFAV